VKRPARRIAHVELPAAHERRPRGAAAPEERLVGHSAGLAGGGSAQIQGFVNQALRDPVDQIPLLVVVLAVGCATPQDEDQITITEKRQVQGDAITKTLQANNCEGTAEMKQDLTAVHQYLHDIELTPNPGVTINRAAVENEIRNYYQIPQGESDAVCIVPVQIPPSVSISSGRSFWLWSINILPISKIFKFKWLLTKIRDDNEKVLSISNACSNYSIIFVSTYLDICGGVFRKRSRFNPLIIRSNS